MIVDESIPRRPPIPRLLPDIPRAGPGPVRFSLEGVPDRERLGIYREFFGRSVCKFDIDPLDGVPFDVDVMLGGMPGLQLFTGRVQGTRCGRSPRVLADGTDGFALVMNLSGPYLAAQRGEEVLLEEGDAVLLSEADSFFLSHKPPGGLLVLRMPRTRLAAHVRGPEDRIMRRIPSASAPLRLLRGYVDAAWSAAAFANDATSYAVSTHMNDLIALALAPSRETEDMAGGRGLRAALLHTIKRDIDENLDQPGLSVGALAHRHACTPRFVQRLFEGEGTTFTDYVLDLRLARAHRLLIDPRRAGDKVSAIALDAGFGDLSYFNRVFRRRYGDTPSGVRG
jgi:AraC-like DNA-binding protein